MTEYARQAAHGAELRTKDMSASTASYRRACHSAADTKDSYDVIRRAVIEQLRSELTEGGAKGLATKVATVALWLRAGGVWPDGRGLTAAYDEARGARVVCPKCSHSFVP